MINEKKIKQLLKEKKIVVQYFDFEPDVDGNKMSTNMITRLAKIIKRRKHFKFPDNIDDYYVSIQASADRTHIFLSSTKSPHSIVIQKRCPSKYDGMDNSVSWEKDVFEMLGWNLPEDKIDDIFECLMSQKEWRGKKDTHSIFKNAVLSYYPKSKQFNMDNVLGFDSNWFYDSLEGLHSKLIESRNDLYNKL